MVRLARQAETDSAPVVRLADRFAAWFLPLTLLLAGAAWLLSGQPVRAVAVLVVATPCPLLLAAPAAIASGLSRTARHGVVVKGGGALEKLGQARTLIVDKTGTLTAGRPRVVDVVAAPGARADDVLRWAAAVDRCPLTSWPPRSSRPPAPTRPSCRSRPRSWRSRAPAPRGWWRAAG
ncbi:hypothetical protein AB0F88_41120 [Streptosporangium sp. NPDC023963]|uniref:P-type ATPase n=1 Tax=Streptosporangium sp. NPDC023963 TaxID=3155608 RepID=UPI003415E628